MTEKRFENRLSKNNLKFLYQNPVWDNLKKDALNVFEMIDLLNELNNVNENNKELIKRAYDDNDRLRNKNERLHKDFDKLWELCKEHFTDEEIIKELDR